MKKKTEPRIYLGDLPLSAIVKQLNALYGANTLAIASEAEGLTIRCLSTGSAALDFGLGGGIPENRITELHGPMSSLKSTILLKTIASFQKRHPDGEAFYEDGEQSFDPDYSRYLGVDNTRLGIINGDSGEQSIDVITKIIRLNRSVFVGLDSVASLVPAAEIEANMDQQFQGLHPRLINRLMRVLKSGMKRNMYDTDASTVTVVATNQLRERIGVTWGNPEITPGGRGKDFYYSVIVKFNSSPSDRLMEKVKRNGIERELRMGQSVRFTVRKNKVAGSQFEEGEFEFYVRPYKDYPAYSINDDVTLFKFGVFYGIVEYTDFGGKKKYVYDRVSGGDEHHFRAAIRKDPETAALLYQDILATIIKEDHPYAAELEDDEPVVVVKQQKQKPKFKLKFRNYRNQEL
jgi:recombination protein RecA